VISADGEDLRALARAWWARPQGPFFAPVKEASINPPPVPVFPRACNCSASTRKISFQFAFPTHRWKRAVAGLVRR